MKELSRWHSVVPLGTPSALTCLLDDDPMLIRLVVPHFSREDDEYNGYFIPKGTAVMGNAWYGLSSMVTGFTERLIYRAIMHDPDIFDDPMEFKPERYLNIDPATKKFVINTSILDPEVAAFGFGRRICPGRHLSNEALSLMAASLLSAFTVNAPKDENGNSMRVQMTTGNGLIM